LDDAKKSAKDFAASSAFSVMNPGLQGKQINIVVNSPVSFQVPSGFGEQDKRFLSDQHDQKNTYQIDAIRKAILVNP
jgi:hypothetical protein